MRPSQGAVFSTSWTILLPEIAMYFFRGCVWGEFFNKTKGFFQVWQQEGLELSLLLGRVPILTVCCPHVLKMRDWQMLFWSRKADLFEIQPLIKLIVRSAWWPTSMFVYVVFSCVYSRMGQHDTVI